MNNIDKQLKDHINDFVSISFSNGDIATGRIKTYNFMYVTLSNVRFLYRGKIRRFRELNIVLDGSIKDVYCLKKDDDER